MVTSPHEARYPGVYRCRGSSDDPTTGKGENHAHNLASLADSTGASDGHSSGSGAQQVQCGRDGTAQVQGRSSPAVKRAGVRQRQDGAASGGKQAAVKKCEWCLQQDNRERGRVLTFPRGNYHSPCIVLEVRECNKR